MNKKLLALFIISLIIIFPISFSISLAEFNEEDNFIKTISEEKNKIVELPLPDNASKEDNLTTQDCSNNQCISACDYSPSCSYTDDDDCYDHNTRKDWYKNTACSGGCTGWIFGGYYDCSKGYYCYDPGDAYCKSCSTSCDGSCTSSNCYGYDPDCTSSGGTYTCCKDSQCSSGYKCQSNQCVISCDYSPSCPYSSKRECYSSTSYHKYSAYTECSGYCGYTFDANYLCATGKYCSGTQYDGVYPCYSCSTSCDGSCQSSNCYNYDPDCTSSGGTYTCCKDSQCSSGYKCQSNQCVRSAYCGDGYCDSGENCPKDCLKVKSFYQLPSEVTEGEQTNINVVIENKGTVTQTGKVEVGIIPTNFYQQEFSTEGYSTPITGCCEANDYFDTREVTRYSTDSQYTIFTLNAPTVSSVDACDTTYPKRSAWGSSFVVVAGAYDLCAKDGGSGYYSYVEQSINVRESCSNNGVSCSYSGDCCSTYCVHGTCRSSSTYCGDGYCDSGESYTNCLTDCKKPNGVSCSTDSQCSSSNCVHGTCRSSDPYCGDSYCDSGESCSSCSSDCGQCSYCGDGSCNGNEDKWTCDTDCGNPCGSNQCRSDYWQQCFNNNELCCSGDSTFGQYYCNYDETWEKCTSSSHSECQSKGNYYCTSKNGEWRWRETSSDCDYCLDKSNSNACDCDSECSSGECVHGTCRSSDPYCGDSYCDSGESYSNCGADCLPPKGHADYCSDSRITCSLNDGDCEPWDCPSGYSCEDGGWLHGLVGYGVCCYQGQYYDGTQCKGSCTAGYTGYKKCVSNDVYKEYKDSKCSASWKYDYSCKSSEYCDNGQCKSKCGNNVCESWESYDGCPTDCFPEEGHKDYCAVISCSHGQGDCDPWQCPSGLHCSSENGMSGLGTYGACCYSNEEFYEGECRIYERHSYKQCVEGPSSYVGDSVYWYDSKNVKTDFVKTCSNYEYCDNGECRPLCGNGVCDSSETVVSCKEDCNTCPIPDGTFGCDCASQADCPASHPYCEDEYPSPISDSFDACLAEPPIQCGNGVCESGETNNCAEDCDWCGDNECTTGESYELCPGDCDIPQGTISIDVDDKYLIPILSARVYKVEGSTEIYLGMTDLHGKFTTVDDLNKIITIKVKCPSEDKVCGTEGFYFEDPYYVKFNCECESDTDGDGFTNSDEVIVGTDPLNANSNIWVHKKDNKFSDVCSTAPASYLLTAELSSSERDQLIESMNILTIEEKTTIFENDNSLQLYLNSIGLTGRKISYEPVALKNAFNSSDSFNGIQTNDAVLIFATDDSSGKTYVFSILSNCQGYLVGLGVGAVGALADDLNFIGQIIGGLFYLLGHPKEVMKVGEALGDLWAGIKSLFGHFGEVVHDAVMGLFKLGQDYNNQVYGSEDYISFELGFFNGFVTGYVIEQVIIGILTAGTIKIGELFGKIGTAIKSLGRVSFKFAQTVRIMTKFGYRAARIVEKLDNAAIILAEWGDEAIEGVSRAAKYLDGGEDFAKAAANVDDILRTASKAENLAFNINRIALESGDNVAELMVKASRTSNVVLRAMGDWSFEAQKGLGNILLRYGDEGTAIIERLAYQYPKYGDDIVRIISEGVEDGVINLAKVEPQKLAEYVGLTYDAYKIIDPMADIGEHQLIRMMKASKGVFVEIVDDSGKVIGKVDNVAVLKKGVAESWGYDHIFKYIRPDDVTTRAQQIQKAFGLADDSEAVLKLIEEELETGTRIGDEVIGNKLKIIIGKDLDKTGAIITVIPK